MNIRNKFFNEDCIDGCKKYFADESIDLIITDPPYGINGDKLHQHYNRKEDFVIDEYVEIPADKYEDFSLKWITQAERILKPGGSIYIISGYTNLYYILKALKNTRLKELNHIIWKYNFGVYTKRKYVSSHYHILFYVKPGTRHTFNTFSRYGTHERTESGGSSNYKDREDVWIINREYKPGEMKNKNQLPEALLKKMIQYSSNEGDLVCDLFLGSFSTAKVAIGMNRDAAGFEINKKAFSYQIKKIKQIKPGNLLKEIKSSEKFYLSNQGKPWTEQEKIKMRNRYYELRKKVNTKKSAIEILSREMGRGHFSLNKELKKNEKKSVQCEMKF